MSSRDWGAAVVAWQQAIADGEVSASTYAGLARALRAQRDLDAAALAVDQGWEYDADDDALLREAGRVALYFYRRSGEDQRHGWKERMVEVAAKLRRHHEAGSRGETTVVLGELSLGLRRWGDAERLWREIAEEHPRRRGEALVKQAQALREQGQLRSAREALERVDAAEQQGDRFRRETSRLSTSLRKWSSTEVAATARLLARTGRATDATNQLRTALHLRWHAVPGVAHLDPLVEAVGRLWEAAATYREGREGPDALLRPPAEIAPSGHPPTCVVHVSGFLYSGSGAVFDLLRGHPRVQLPFGQREVGFLKKPGNLADVLAPDACALDEFPVTVVEVVLASVFGFGQSGRPLLGFVTRNEDDVAALAELTEQLVLRLGQAWTNARAEERALESQLVEAHVRDYLDRVIAGRMEAADRVAPLNNAIVGHQLDRVTLLSRARAIGVYRDPRDQYVSQLLESPHALGHDEFAQMMEERYRDFERLLDGPVGEQLLAVCFEDFVTSEACRREVVAWAGLEADGWDPDDRAFDPSRSQRNVGIHKTFSAPEEVAEVGRRLLPHYERLRSRDAG